MTKNNLVIFFIYEIINVLISGHLNGQKLCANKSGTVHAFIVWWTLEMEPTNSIPPISIAPKWIDNDNHSAWRDHWMQAVYFPKKAIYLNKGDQFGLIFCHDTLSMSFDLFCSSNLFNDVLKPNSLRFCNCGLHYSWSRSRICELNTIEYRDFSMKMINIIKERISTKNKIKMLIFSDSSYLSYLIGQCFNNFDLSFSIYHLDTSPSSCFFLQSIYDKFNFKNKSNIQVYSSLNEIINMCCVLNDHAKDSDNSFDIVLAEPYTCFAVLPWDSLHFWYALQKCFISLPELFIPTSLLRIIPSRLRIYAVLVEFENLWRTRNVVGSCEGFKLSCFDELTLEASKKVDNIIEPHSLWEYTNWARSSEKMVFDITLINNKDYGLYFETIPDCIRCNGSQLTPTSLGSNGIVFWAEWFYDDEVSSQKSWWYCPSGPTKPIIPDTLIEWKPYGPQQGVYLNSHRICENYLKPVDIKVNFDTLTGNISIHID